MPFLFNTALRLESLSGFIGRLGAWAIVGLMLVIVTDVTLRHWFVIGSTKLQELEWHLHGTLFLLCLGWTYTKNGHVRIELLSERFSPRTAAWVELIGCLLLLLPYVFAVLHFGWDYTAYSFRFDEGSSSATGLPNRWIIKFAIVFGFIFLAAAGIGKALQAFIYIFDETDLRHKTVFSRSHRNGGGK